MSTTNEEITQPIKRPRGRKPKSYYLDLSNNNIINDKPTEPKIKLKRGRKSVGGKIVEIKSILVSKIPAPNIILHLNCKLSDIEYINNNMKYNPNIEDDNNINECNNSLQYNFINNTIDKENTIYSLDNYNNSEVNQNTFIANYDTLLKKNISKKLKELSFNLKYNNIYKKSDCFWCTFSFNNEPIIIPKYELNKKIYCYGCFCSPECACAYLMNENIDSSTKFERYYLLNNIYGKIYEYNKNIKPAPSPYYLLDKYFGNLDIEEYRKLLENERLLLIVEKPLTQVLPELYEENEDFLINTKIVSKSKK